MDAVYVIRTGCPVSVGNVASAELQDPFLSLRFNKSTLSGNLLCLGLYSMPGGIEIFLTCLTVRLRSGRKMFY